MIELSDVAQSVLTNSYRYFLRVESWLGDQLLHDDIPVASGTEEGNRSARVPERVTLTVPRVERGFSWTPDSRNHPLAANGQRLRVLLGIDTGNGVIEWLQRGWFVIKTAAPSGDAVSVEAVGLLWLIEEARLVSPYQPSGTLLSTLRGLVEPALTVVLDSAVTNRSVPSGINYDEDRLGAVLELLEAWPADAFVTADGYLSVVPDMQSSTPVLSLTDGVGGTVITVEGSSAREGAANVVVARGTASDGGQIQGVAYDNSGGPKSINSDFNPLPVPYFYSSPLLTTVAQCTAAAQKVLARLQRDTSREFAVEMVPHPGLQLGDVVSLTTGEFEDLPCAIESMNLPYTSDGGAQRLMVRSLS